MNTNLNSHAVTCDKKEMSMYIRKITSEYLQNELTKLSDKLEQPPKPIEKKNSEKLNGFKFLWTPRYKRYLLTL